MEEQANPEVIVCEICGTYSGTKAQLRGHRMQCKIKSEQPLKMKSPEELQAELDEARAQLAAFQRPELEREIPKREEPIRRKRTPIGVRRQRLSAPEDPTKYYYVFNDNWQKRPNRVQQALDAGFTPVEGYTDQGVVGTNDDRTPIRGVELAIPMEWHEEDEALKEEERAKTDASINAGTFKAQPTDKRYIPAGVPSFIRNR